MYFFLASALAGTPVTVTYTLSENADPKAPEGYRYSGYVEKQVVWVASGQTYLHPEGKQTSDAGHLLPVGTAVTVVSAAKAPEYVEGKMDVWYQVVTPFGSGWVHGGALSPFGFSGDFDQDGETEFATVAFNTDFSIRVVVVEPNPRAGAEAWISVDAAGGAYLGVQGSDMHANLLRAKVASVPLIHVHSGVEACADFADYWISYRSTGPGVVGTVRVALEQTGLMDPPSSSTYEVKFDAKRKTAVITRTEGGEDDQGRETQKIEKSTYDLINGVYKEEKDGHAVR